MPEYAKLTVWSISDHINSWLNIEYSHFSRSQYPAALTKHNSEEISTHRFDLSALATQDFFEAFDNQQEVMERINDLFRQVC